MKKLLLLAGLTLAFSANAQVIDGSVAPELSADSNVDQFGVTHSILDYLAQGKTVIVDISATWCGPCWNYHENHVLDDLYYSYGQGGSNEIVVLFVEGDPGTPEICLTDTTVPDDYGTYSQGNWIEGAPYPIINNNDIAADISLEHFPTILKIKPDGTMYEIGQLTPAQVRNNLTADGLTLTGVTNKVLASAADLRTCVDNNIFKVKMKNLSQTAVTSATIVLKQDGSVVDTKNWTGTNNQFQTATINMNSFATNETSVYAAEIQTVNGNAVVEPTLAMTDLPLHYAQPASTTVTVNVYTDYYPSEISWKIRNGSNTVIASGGPYEAGTDDSFGGGGPDANTIKTVSVTLPDGADCYRVDMLDAYGDGWSVGQEQHGIEIVNADNTIAYANFTNETFTTLNTSSAFKVEAQMGVEDLNNRTFAIFPNPSNGIFNVRTLAPATITVTDLTGKVVYNATQVTDNSQLNLTSLQSGMYLAQVTVSGNQTVEKLVIK